MKIIVISSSRKSEEEPQMVCELFENGLQTFHLRKTKFSTRELKNYILQIPSQYHDRIVIHSHHNLAFKFKLRGIHLTKSHLGNKLKTWIIIHLLKIKRPHLIVSTSFSKLSNLYDTDVNYDYVFLSPIFDSLTSKYQSGFTEQSLKTVMAKTKFTVIARGGVDIDSIQKVNEIGFHGIALYNAIWRKQDPVSEFIRIQKKIQELGITQE